MRLFGTDGIRGMANEYPIEPMTIVRLGMALAKVLKKDGRRNMILIGKDTRLSGYMIESALTSGICSMGMNVMLVGPIPTPGVAFLTKTLRLDAGVVISASHNSAEYNGIKCFSHDGFKLPDELEYEIERLLQDLSFMSLASPHSIGKAYRLEDATGRYIEYIKSTIPRNVKLEGLRVIVDSANGAAYKVTPWLLRELGVDVISINDKPDGFNINKECGSLNPEPLREAVIKNCAHAGIAHDGDADRTIFVDEKGNIVDGDHILGMCAMDLKKQGRLRGNTVVSTVMSNLGLEHFFMRHNIRLLRTKVGDRFVVEKMVEGGYVLGGEQSGHIIFLDHNTTGDGPVTSLQVLYLMYKNGRYLSELTSDIIMYPQVLVNVDVKDTRDPSEIKEVSEVLRKAVEKLSNRGRILLRKSGTEPKVRVMVEGEDNAMIKDIADTIADAVKKYMN